MNRCVHRLALVVALGVVAVNVLAYHHASSFFFYRDGGERTPSPESLSWARKLGVLITGIRVPKPVAHSDPSDFGLTFSDISVPGREGMALAGWLIDRPDADTVVVLFHGYSSERSGLLPEARVFAELGCRVVMVDFPGSGGSPGNRTTLGIDEARDVATVFDWIATVYPDRRIVLYGHSMGGAAIMRSMALLDVRPDAAVVESVFDSLLEAIRQRFRLMSVPPFPLAEILLFWAGYQLDADGFGHDVVAYAGQVTAPTLILHGAGDTRADWRRAQRVFEALAAERKAMKVIAGAGHVNPCLADPAAWREAVGAFLAAP